jgi:endo-1,4-beta-mannosidase
VNFRLGVNYWPATSAMRWWRRFDASEVSRDFARIREAGLDWVRIFLLWEDFQPYPDAVPPLMLARLVTVADVAAHNHLSLVPTLFTGHMSGVNWIPRWALEAEDSRHPSRFRTVASERILPRARLKNWYADEDVTRAQVRLAREAAGVLSGHPALWAWDLGNENSNCVVPPTRDAGRAWLERIAGEIRSVDSSSSVTLGLHMEDLEEDRRLGPCEVASVCDFLCMHGYSIYADWAEGPTDECVLPFLGLVTRWLGGRDVLFEEFGAPTRPLNEAKGDAAGRVPLLAEEEAARFTRRALVALREFGLAGAGVWGYADYRQHLWREPPLDEAEHERHFGLWRSDYSPKPALAEVGRMSGASRREVEDDFSWADVDAADYYANPRDNLRRLYGNFRRRY